MPQSAVPVDILVIEDNAADAQLMTIAWRECGLVQARVRVLSDSRSVAAYLRGQMEYEGQPHPRPHLIMLDYVMPTDGGIALLEIKGDPDFKTIPVVVFTSSRNPRDHQQIYERNANCCFLKPDSLQGHLDLVCYLAEFWLTRVVPPPRNSVSHTIGATDTGVH